MEGGQGCELPNGRACVYLDSICVLRAGIDRNDLEKERERLKLMQWLKKRK